MSNTAKKATVAAELVNTVSTMTVVKDAKGSNGNGKVEDAVAEVIPEAIPEVKEIVKVTAPEPVKAPVPELTLEQTLEKVDDLNRIIAKYQRLQEARKNLNTFKIGSDGLNMTIIIKDASGQEFKTSHNIVVETVLSTVKQILNEKITEVEKDINFKV